MTEYHCDRDKFPQTAVLPPAKESLVIDRFVSEVNLNGNLIPSTVLPS